MKTVKEAIIETLREKDKPMRVGDITRAVLRKTSRLKGKTPHNTVNAVLRTDPRFKRIAKGTYVLGEWKGYKEMRLVKDIAYELLKNEGKPMPLEAITQAVLEERALKGHAGVTIRHILLNDERFVEGGGKVYNLAEWAAI